MKMNHSFYSCAVELCEQLLQICMQKNIHKNIHHIPNLLRACPDKRLWNVLLVSFSKVNVIALIM